MSFLKRLFGSPTPEPWPVQHTDPLLVCTVCEEPVPESEVLKATIFALADSDELTDAFDFLPWVDADGNEVRPSLQGAELPDGRPVASLATISAGNQDLRNNPIFAQHGVGIGPESGIPLWSTTHIASLMRRLESLGYARYVLAANGWNWPVACPTCQHRRLSGHSTGQRRERPDLIRDSIAPRRRFAIMQRDAFRCVYCGRTAASGAVLHVDHVIPIASGGVDDDENFVTACDECNLGKSDSDVFG